jgi:hypothetical protein
MKSSVLIAIFGFLIFNCRDHDNQKFTNSKLVTIYYSTISAKPRTEFYSLFGIDSVAKADYVFVNNVVDSISIQKCSFSAI